MANTTIALLCVCGVVLVGCTRDEVTPVIERPATVANPPGWVIDERFVFGVEAGRRHLRAGRNREAEKSFTHALNVRAMEPTIYSHWLTGVFYSCGSGDVAVALEWLATFNTALRVDFGDEPCFVRTGPSGVETPNSKLPDQVFEEMCLGATLRTDLDARPRAERERHAALRDQLEWESAALRQMCADLTE